MGQYLLTVVLVLTIAAIVFGMTAFLMGGDGGLAPAEPDGRSRPLPGNRPLAEEDVVGARFDTAIRGYRMRQVDEALQRTAYDIGYKDELISVLQAEVTALREGRTGDADVLLRARESAVAPEAMGADGAGPAAYQRPAVARPAAGGAEPVDPAPAPSGPVAPAAEPAPTAAPVPAPAPAPASAAANASAPTGDGAPADGPGR